MCVCLCVKADGTKLKPFIVFKGAKRDIAKLNEEFRGKWLDEHPLNH